MDPVNTRPKGMSIAIGNNAKIDLGTRTEEALLSFGYGKERGKDDDRFGYTIAGNTEAKENLPEGIAIGTNSFARAGSIEIGAHNLGADVEIGDRKGSEFSTYGFSRAAGRQLGVASTTVGTNLYANGMFTTTYGSYNVQSSQYQELHVVDTILDGYKNAFGTVVGSLNSNESIAAFPHSGAENSIIGTGNRVNNMFPILIFNMILLLIIFYLIDKKQYRKDIANGLRPDISKPGVDIKVEGLHNVVFLVAIVVAVILSGTLPSLPMFQDAAGNVLGITIYKSVKLTFPAMIEIAIILLAALLSFKTTNEKIRTQNHFTWGAIQEVAILFIGIFITMQPALALLKTMVEVAFQTKGRDQITKIVEKIRQIESVMDIERTTG